jgi:hypothetical protein
MSVVPALKRLIKKPSSAPAPAPAKKELTPEQKVEKTQETQEKKAAVEEVKVKKKIQKRRRLKQTGGQRLLFSSKRLSEQALATPGTKLGSE